ncbi:carbohydrate-binding protein [Emticicia sp. 17c]|uniref:carbohydrate-binding protein n=1 Tax=Emticicia sp. 17c TaxID=3127704 RepID=UPI00301C6E51
MKQKYIMRFYLFVALLAGFTACSKTATSRLSGQAWMNTIQEIPGKIECEYYNNGGEGVAYHDTDAINNGSGKLNPPNGNFLNEFRMKEAVDISYTKQNDIDNTPYNKVAPEMNKFYVGWTEPGEWINYTVKVKETATYAINLMYTANGDGVIGLDIDGKPLAKELKVISTYDANDPVAWRQWHHWNKSETIAKVVLSKGIHTLTLHTVAHGNMNYDYLEFKKI